MKLLDILSRVTNNPNIEDELVFAIVDALTIPEWIDDREPADKDRVGNSIVVMATILETSTTIGDATKKTYVHEMFYELDAREGRKWKYRNGSWLCNNQKVIAWLPIPHPYKIPESPKMVCR